MSYVDGVIKRGIKENPNEQAFRRGALLEGRMNPERQIQFRAPWIDDNAQVPDNIGWERLYWSIEKVFRYNECTGWLSKTIKIS